ncbi:SH3 domain-containing protein [Massilia antarctica]|uniref:SH3 domain-containing protein n=1 Tax=Massilia antarctica TaxID=2765360 RepID=UPI0006BB8704|nr:SH3 domain-containing protein [Massilia sp. H27-R4]MCY0911282.1 SH3 domain-containing protein [Massilia sp. H27-R4]CUI05123.1 hypothetical protein BN2497_5023 [Janthinobacterium sp. CG23_2]CUU28909.1 hypothetical protein BN3177_5023 [Janthinobacterium sp. CG23_2]
MRIVALSTTALLAPLAHAAPEAAAQRWVDGVDVIVRAAPQSSAAVVARLARNTVVTLVSEESAVGYCDIRTLDGAAGYAACRYLARAPVSAAGVPGQPGQAGVDPERAFWIQPTWSKLEAYAEYLKQRHPKLPQQGPFPRDEALERMKAHLALGTYGSKPAPFADWSDLKRKVERLRARGKVNEVVLPGGEASRQLPDDARFAIGLEYAYHGDEGMKQRQLTGLIGALEFAGVTPSLFRSEAQVAPPNSTTAQASGRFGIVFRQLLHPRPKPATVSDNDYSPGLYDMLSHTDALVRSVSRIQLSRDGRLRVEPSVVRKSETLWRYADEPECEGWVPGFAFGAADAGPWRFFGRQATAHKNQDPHPPGSLFAFYTTVELPPGPAAVREASMTLDRARTGFIGGTHLYFDLDADGIADLAVWEGEGKGPGDIERPGSTDDRWYRLVLVNINGSWKLLGSDTFGYGCGC